MAATIFSTVLVIFSVLTFVAWRRSLWVAGKARRRQVDTCPYSSTDVSGGRHLAEVQR
jgi:hypothetical protein